MSDTTLHKIAAAVGLSISTVSRALKGHPDISVQTRKKFYQQLRHSTIPPIQTRYTTPLEAVIL